MIRFEIKKYWRNRNFLLIFLFVIFCIGITFYQAVTGSGLLVQDTMTSFSDIDMKYLPTAPLLEKRTELVTQVEKINQKDALHDLRTLYSLEDEAQKLTQPYYVFSDFSKDENYYKTVNTYIQNRLHFYKSYAQFVEKYPNVLSFSNAMFQRNLQWKIQLFTYLADHQEKASAPYLYMGGLYDSTIQNIIYYAPLYLGLPAIFFFSLLFYASQSRDREMGTTYLLKTQPASSVRQMASKLVAIFFCIFFYLAVLFLGLTLLFCFLGVPLGGWEDAFRRFTNLPASNLICGGPLLVKMCFAFMSLVFLEITFCFLLGNLLKTQSVLAVLLLVNLALFVGSSASPLLKSQWNPIYISQSFKAFTGYIDYDKNITIFASSFRPYLVMECVGVAFFTLAVITEKRSLYTSNRFAQQDKSTIKKHSVYYIEGKKILLSERTWIYFIGLLAYLFILFLNLHEEKLEQKQGMQEGKGWSVIYLEAMQEAKKEKQKWNASEDSYDDKNEVSEQSDQENPYQYMIDTYLEQYKNAKQSEESYRKGDGAGYYDSWNHKMDEEGREGYLLDKAYKHHQNSLISLQDSKVVFEQAQEQQEAPILLPAFLFSPREEYTDTVGRWQIQQNLRLPEEGVSFWLYDLLYVQKWDIVLFLFLINMVFTGYTVEKRSGSSLAINYTMPLERWRFHIRKAAAHFLLATGIFIGLLLLATFLALCVSGWGSFSFPVLAFHGDKVGTMSIGRFLMLSLPVLLFWMAFLSSLSLFVSIFTRNKETLLMAILGITSLSLFLNAVLPCNWKALNPFSYLETSALVDGSLFFYQGFIISVSQALLVLGAWTLFFLLLGGSIVSRQSIQKTR